MDDSTGDIEWCSEEELQSGQLRNRINSLLEKQPAAVAKWVDKRTPEQKAADTAAREERDRQYRRESEINERKRQLKILGQNVGQLYLEKKLDQREVYGTAVEQQRQRVAFAKTDAFIVNLKDNVKIGRNLVLVGARGTGKDLHLTNVMTTAIWKYGYRVLWRDGAKLYLTLRASIGGNSQFTEEQLIYQLETAPILAISDPVPPIGPITEYQASVMLSVIDERYRKGMPTWVTLNVATRKEAEERLGSMLVDRLFENAEIVFHDWPSYREFSRARQLDTEGGRS